ncbi:hypothetical protein [Paenibacillus sp. Root444D2]|uniref:hypothetical protein n=1 Tax=Paenibacillus sp. Root444D2 TaxID=1736538 RepID=UPI000709A936|nr:hypothetical protein [Paenibacillus sp. Root444D2]KQX68076.1 hypothetical protein ASD40_24635 [Paenibacillus sp. Root444D2]
MLIEKKFLFKYLSVAFDKEADIVEWSNFFIEHPLSQQMGILAKSKKDIFKGNVKYLISLSYRLEIEL